ncbi:MAG TPA: hypothetical protein VGN26_06005 [Armatimonadota bacterium]|jgi:hypothetical protein
MIRRAKRVAFPVLLGLAGMLAFAGPVKAQDTVVLPDKGTTEYNINGDISFSGGGQQVAVAWAPFMNRNWQWGVEAAYSHVNHGDSILAANALLNYYLRREGEGRTLPYIGATLGGYFLDASGVTYGAHVGVKHFINSNVALMGQLQWRHFQDARPKNPVDFVIGLAIFR